MKLKLIILSLAMALSANGADRFVTPSGGTVKTGLSWAFAWSPSTINWASVNAGDTVWFAGGTYDTHIDITTSGNNVGGYITLKRATALDAACTNAAGWSAAFDATVVFHGYIKWDLMSYIHLDGNTNATEPYGWKFERTAGNRDNGHWVNWMDWVQVGSNSKNTGITSSNHWFNNIEYSGAADTETVGAPHAFGIDNWTTGDTGRSYDIIVEHCYIHHETTALRFGVCSRVLVEHNIIADIKAATHATGIHCDGICYYNACRDTITRFNEFRNVTDEVLWYHNPNGYDPGAHYIYGNICWWYNSTPPYIGPTRYFIGFRPAASAYGMFYGPAYIFNNVIATGDGNHTVCCEAAYIYNNVFLGDASVGGEMSGSIDYNAWSSIPSYYNSPHSFVTSWDAFATSTGDFTPVLSPPSGVQSLVGRGTNLNAIAIGTVASIAYDSSGQYRGDGAWDVGVLTHDTIAPTNTPIMRVSPSTPYQFGYIPTNTSASVTFTVSNLGTSNLWGSASVSDPSLSIVGASSYVIATNASSNIVVRYYPTATGFLSGSATFTCVSGNQSISLFGAGYPILSMASITATNGAISPSLTSGASGIYAPGPGPEGQFYGAAIWGFNVSTPGLHVVSNWVTAPDAASDSWWVDIDSDPTAYGTINNCQKIWDVTPNSASQQRIATCWRDLGCNQYAVNPKVWNLTAGTHYLCYYGRSPLCVVSNISIVHSNNVVWTNQPVTLPVRVLSATNYDFGFVPTNTVREFVFTIANTATNTLTGYMLPSSLSPFSITNNTNYVITAHSSSNITVRFFATSQSPDAFETNTISFVDNSESTDSLEVRGLAFNILDKAGIWPSSGVVISPATRTSPAGEIYSPSENAGVGLAVYGFNITSNTWYVVTNLASAATSGNNSWYIDIDTDPTNWCQATWDTPITSGYEFRGVSWWGPSCSYLAPDIPVKAWSLQEGDHYLVFRTREASCYISNIAIVAMSNSPTCIAPQWNPPGMRRLLASTLGVPITLESYGASGTAPITYRWYKDGSLIVGESNTNYTFTPILATEAGVYSCTASNACGLISSSVELIFIYEIGPDRAISATSHNFMFVPTNTPSDWVLTITNTGNEDLSGYLLPSVIDPFFIVTETNYTIPPAGTSNFTIRFYASDQSPDAIEQSTIFFVDNAPTYETLDLYGVGINILNRSNIWPDQGVVTMPVVKSAFGELFSIDGVWGSGFGVYGFKTTEVGWYIVSNLVYTLDDGGNAGIHNSWFVNIDSDPTNWCYMAWGVPTNAAYTGQFVSWAGATCNDNIPHIPLQAWALLPGDHYLIYRNRESFCYVSNICITLMSNETSCVTPYFKPGGWFSQLAAVGDTVSWTNISAGGTAPLSYQWSFNNFAMPGKTDVGLTLTNVQYSDAGNYMLTVTNACGRVSGAVALKIGTNPPPPAGVNLYFRKGP